MHKGMKVVMMVVKRMMMWMQQGIGEVFVHIVRSEGYKVRVSSPMAVIAQTAVVVVVASFVEKWMILVCSLLIMGWKDRADDE